MNNKYKGVIFTNHALKRLSERGVSQGDAWITFSRSDQSRYAASKGAWIYYKTYKDQKIEVVAKKNEKGEWLILSVWSRPVFQKHNFSKKAPDSFFVNLLKTIIGKG